MLEYMHASGRHVVHALVFVRQGTHMRHTQWQLVANRAQSHSSIPHSSRRRGRRAAHTMLSGTPSYSHHLSRACVASLNPRTGHWRAQRAGQRNRHRSRTRRVLGGRSGGHCRRRSDRVCSKADFRRGGVHGAHVHHRLQQAEGACGHH
jgi:hypothetical protein